MALNRHPGPGKRELTHLWLVMNLRSGALSVCKT